MDSHWFYQAMTGSSNNNRNLKSAGSTLDLSLKLDFTNKQQDENELQLGLSHHSSPMSPKLHNFRFNGSFITEEANQHEMADGRGKVAMNHNGTVAGGSSTVDNYGSRNTGGGGATYNHGMFPSWNQVTSGYGFNNGGGSAGVNSSYNHVKEELFGTVARNLGSNNPGGMPPLTPTMNYTLIDHVPRSAGREAGSSSCSRRRSSRQQREAQYFDPDKRCSNINCKTNNTPMWRRGPLGPKTLCNACGIKYRKEAEKRRAEAPTGPNAYRD